jgi:hypothetical protein
MVLNLMVTRIADPEYSALDFVINVRVPQLGVGRGAKDSSP